MKEPNWGGIKVEVRLRTPLSSPIESTTPCAPASGLPAIASASCGSRKVHATQPPEPALPAPPRPPLQARTRVAASATAVDGLRLWARFDTDRTSISQVKDFYCPIQAKSSPRVERRKPGSTITPREWKALARQAAPEGPSPSGAHGQPGLPVFDSLQGPSSSSEDLQSSGRDAESLQHHRPYRHDPFACVVVEYDSVRDEVVGSAMSTLGGKTPMWAHPWKNVNACLNHEHSGRSAQDTFELEQCSKNLRSLPNDVLKQIMFLKKRSVMVKMRRTLQDEQMQWVRKSKKESRQTKMHVQHLRIATRGRTMSLNSPEMPIKEKSIAKGPTTQLLGEALCVQGGAHSADVLVVPPTARPDREKRDGGLDSLKEAQCNSTGEASKESEDGRRNKADEILTHRPKSVSFSSATNIRKDRECEPENYNLHQELSSETLASFDWVDLQDSHDTLVRALSLNPLPGAPPQTPASRLTRSSGIVDNTDSMQTAQGLKIWCNPFGNSKRLAPADVVKWHARHVDLRGLPFKMNTHEQPPAVQDTDQDKDLLHETCEKPLPRFEKGEVEHKDKNVAIAHQSSVGSDVELLMTTSSETLLSYMTLRTHAMEDRTVKPVAKKSAEAYTVQQLPAKRISISKQDFQAQKFSDCKRVSLHPSGAMTERNGHPSEDCGKYIMQNYGIRGNNIAKKVPKSQKVDKKLISAHRQRQQRAPMALAGLTIVQTPRAHDEELGEPAASNIESASPAFQAEKLLPSPPERLIYDRKDQACHVHHDNSLQRGTSSSDVAAQQIDVSLNNHLSHDNLESENIRVFASNYASSSEKLSENCSQARTPSARSQDMSQAGGVGVDPTDRSPGVNNHGHLSGAVTEIAGKFLDGKKLNPDSPGSVVTQNYGIRGSNPVDKIPKSAKSDRNNRHVHDPTAQGSQPDVVSPAIPTRVPSDAKTSLIESAEVVEEFSRLPSQHPEARPWSGNLGTSGSQVAR